MAVLTCQPIIVECLLEHGADANAIDRNGQTALHLACKNADLQNIQALRKFKPEDSEKSIKVDLKNYEGKKVKIVTTTTTTLFPVFFLNATR